MKHFILSFLVVLFLMPLSGQEKQLIIDTYSISKKIPENAKDISLSIHLTNKDNKVHTGTLKVEIKDQAGKLFLQNEKKVFLESGKSNECKYAISFTSDDKYSIHYDFSEDSGKILEKTFVWETKPVNFFYSFATPHRLTVALPDNSNKTLLDLYSDKLEMSWTYDNLIYYPFDAYRTPRTDWKISIQPLINDKPFNSSKWERSDGYLPVLKNTYEDKDVSVIFEITGADSAAIVKISLTNKSNVTQNIKIPFICPGGWKGYNPGWIDNTLPTDYLLAGWFAPADKLLLLGIGADNFPTDSVSTNQMNMNWVLKSGVTKTGWLIRPYNNFAKDVAYLKSINWQKKFDESNEIWRNLINQTSKILIPDSGITNGFYASIADLFIMREPIGKGYIGIIPGTEVYRSCPNPFEPAIVTVALDQIGLHKEAEAGYRVNWDIQTADGDWSEPGGWSHTMWGASGYKAWALMEHFFTTNDTAFLVKRYPQMLACSRWQKSQRLKTRKDINGKKTLTYGLMPRGMGDGGMMDGKSLYGVFYTHNIWAVYNDSLAYNAAVILNRKDEAKELKGIYESAKSDLITSMELGAIKDENGKRRLSSVPGKNTGSSWGLLNSIYPTGILPGNHELMNNTIDFNEKLMSPGGIPVHTGWMVEGMWVALALNDFAEAHLARNEGSIANAFLYATLNHGTPLYTWCEERGQFPDTKEISGDRQHLWTPVAVVRTIRDLLIMEDGNTLQLMRGIAKGWLMSGEYVGIENAPSRFGVVSYKVKYNNSKSTITGEIHFPKNIQNFETIVHLPLPENLKISKVTGATVLPDGSGIKFTKCSGDVTFEVQIKKIKF
jgi:hypothetical protein